ncbi:MAG: protein kinase [Acidobacteriota bacterium]
MEPGSHIGPYEILDLIGSGGMGEVYRARDTHLGRKVALKVLPSTVTEDSELYQRFEREARSASMLSHPSIVTIYDVGRTSGQPFIVMELVEGESLHKIIDHEAPMPVKRALEIAICVSEGLAVAHARGIVHRDLKPDNLMVGAAGTVKILDFGLAKLDESPEHGDDTARLSKRITEPGTILGTVGYMSPEQAVGDPVDFRTDQFALGTILFEMLTGLRPFQRATTIETLSAVMREDPPNIQQINRQVPETLCWIIERLLGKRSEDRYGSTSDLTRDLQKSLQHLPSPTQPRAASTRLRVPAGKTPRLVFGGVLIAAALAALAWLGIHEAQTQEIPDRKYLAVLPFKDLSGQPGGQLFSDGVSETVSARLAGLPGIQVMPASVTSSVRDETDLGKIATEFGANLILRGTVQRSNGQIRITYMLVHPERGSIAGATVQGPDTDIFALEDRLADRVVDALDLNVQNAVRQPTTGLENADDQQRYLSAIGLLQRYERADSVDEAIRLLQNMSPQAERSALLHAALGRAFLYRYNLSHDPAAAQVALREADRAAALDPANSEVSSTRGELSLATGNTQRAIDEFRRALSQSPDSPQATIGLAQAYEAHGDSDEARKMYERAIALRPGFWGGYSRLGVFYAKQGNLNEATKMFETVTRLTPDNARGYLQLGNVYLSREKVEDALEAYSHSIRIEANADALSNRAFCFYLLGRFGAAAQSLETAVQLSPRDYLLWLNLADAYRWTPALKTKAATTYEKAVALANDALKVNPNDAQAHAVLALSLSKIGQVDDAVRHADRAIAISPADPTNFYAEAVVSTIAGKREAALDWLRKAKEAGYPSWQIDKDPEFDGLMGRRRPAAIAG